MSKTRKILSHSIIVLSGFFLVLMILDSYNPTKDFIEKSISVGLFAIFCLACGGFAVLSLLENK